MMSEITQLLTVFRTLNLLFPLPYRYKFSECWTDAIAEKPDNTHLVVGMSDGTLSIRTRTVKMQEVVQQKQKQQQLKGGSYRYFLRGKNSQASKVSAGFDL